MGKQIMVVGSFFEDLCGRGPSLPKPGETLIGSLFTYGPGGKGSNQAIAARRAGADVTMVTKVGSDPYGAMMLEFYQSEGIRTGHVFIDETRATGIALILVDENTGENAILVVPGACHNISSLDMESTAEAIANSDLLMVQLEINMDATIQAMKTAHENGVPILMNPAPAQKLDDSVYRMVDYLTPNETETELLTGYSMTGTKNLHSAADWFLKRGVKNVLITLGKEGVYVRNHVEERLVPGFLVETVDTTGAGDAFNGCLAVALLENMDILQAAAFANAGGALSVMKIGTAPAMPLRKDIEAFLKDQTARKESAT